MVAVAAVGRKERCLAAMCEMLVTDAVGACEWNGP